MRDLRRISGDHGHIFLFIEVIDPKFRVRDKDRLLCISVDLYHAQLCGKFTVNEYAPDLRLRRVVLRDLYLERLDGIHVVRGHCLDHYIGSVRDGDGYRMSLFIGIDCRCAVLTDNNRLCRSKIEASIRIYGKLRLEVCRKSGTFKERRFRIVPIVRYLDKLERLLDDLFLRCRGP